MALIAPFTRVARSTAYHGDYRMPATERYRRPADQRVPALYWHKAAKDRPTSLMVRRAAAFIDAHADQPITLADIAAAAGTTSRAVQHAFRRYYDMTPAWYLRRVRLARAHQQLRAADPASGVTVAAVARQWGWASPNQFSAASRRHFGLPPSQTLRS